MQKPLLSIVAAFLLASHFPASGQENWVTLGHRALDRGEFHEAVDAFRHAVDLLTRNGAPRTDLVRIRISLSSALLDINEYREAEQVLRDADTFAATLPNGSERAELYNAWGALHLISGRVAAAEAEFEKALQILEPMPEAGEDLPVVLHNLAALQTKTGRYEEALKNFDKARVLVEKNFGPDYPQLIKIWGSLGSLQYLTGRGEQAEVSLKRAVALAEKRYGLQHPILLDLLRSYAVVLDGLDRKKEAKQVRKRAASIDRSGRPASFQPTPPPTVDVREALAGPASALVKIK